MSSNREAQETGALGSEGKNRSGPDEGYDAPPAKETGVAQHSVFDGAGNETVVVTGTNPETGKRKQGTGPTAADAMEDVQDASEPIGEGFGATHKDDHL